MVVTDFVTGEAYTVHAVMLSCFESMQRAMHFMFLFYGLVLEMSINNS